MKKHICCLLFCFSSLYAWTQYQHEIPPLTKKLTQTREDTVRINLLIDIGMHYMFSSEVPNYLDSAAIFLNQAVQLSVKLNEPALKYKALEELAFRSSLAGEYDSAKQRYLQIIDWYHKTGQFAREGKMWVELGERYGHYHDSQYLDETIGYFQRARSLLLEHNLPVAAAAALTDIANRRIDFKQFDLAEKELLQALAEFKAAGHNKLQNTYYILYTLYINQGNYYRAAATLVESIGRMKVENDSSNAARNYELIAECNMAVNKYGEAIGWINKASAINKKRYTLKALLARCYLELNRMEEARLILQALEKKQYPDGVYIEDDKLNWTIAHYYKKANNNEQAVRYYLKALETINKPFIEEYNNKWRLMCFNGLAEIYVKTNDVVNAKKYIDKASLIIKTSKTSLDPALVADFYNHSYKYESAVGNYITAIKNLEERVAIQDSLFNADKDKQLAELNIQYETRQKEQAIKDLQNQTLVQQAKTEKANLQRNITIAGILVMIGVSYLFYRNYRQKKAANNIISSKNTQLQHLITEKEWLLKEVHHRVKNNLHTIIGLLQSQATYLQDDALKANQISKHRIYAMSLIHQQLYKTEDIKSTDMAVFLPELLDYLAESFGTEKRVRFSHAISPVRLGISQAIPVALMVNEAVTNAIKYAFPNDRSGTVTVSMQQSPGGRITLTIADDGVGMDPSIIREETNSLGVKLLFGLTGEIDGKIDIANKNGTIIRISFDPDPLNDLEYLSRNN